MAKRSITKVVSVASLCMAIVLGTPTQARADVTVALQLAAAAYKNYEERQKTQSEFAQFQDIREQIENAKAEILGRFDRQELNSAESALATAQIFTPGPAGDEYIFNTTYGAYLNVIGMANSEATDYETRRTALTAATQLSLYALIAIPRNNHASRFREIANKMITDFTNTLHWDNGGSCRLSGLFGIAADQVMNPKGNTYTINCRNVREGRDGTRRVCDMGCESRTFGWVVAEKKYLEQVGPAVPQMPGYMDLQRIIWSLGDLRDHAI